MMAIVILAAEAESRVSNNGRAELRGDNFPTRDGERY